MLAIATREQRLANRTTMGFTTRAIKLALIVVYKTACIVPIKNDHDP